MLLIAPLIATAQLSSNQKIEAEVPFKFTVANKTLPAGEVTLKLTDRKGWVLAISNPEAKLSMYVFAVPAQAKKAATASALIFRKYGNHCFLASARIGGSRDVYEFRPSPLESEMRAHNVQATEQVLIASLR